MMAFDGVEKLKTEENSVNPSIPSINTPPAQRKDPWQEAFNSLAEEEDKTTLNAVNATSPDILGDLLATINQKKVECTSKSWRFVIGGRRIMLRELFEKISTWVEKFVVVGDAIAQNIPHHAELPWAAIRLIVQATIDDTQTFALVVERLETLTNSMVQCRVLDRLYLHAQFDISDQLYSAIIKHHASVLQYLAAIMRYFGTKTAMRFFRATLKDRQKLDELYGNTEKEIQRVKDLAAIAETERNVRIEQELLGIRTEGSERLGISTAREAGMWALLNELQQPIERIDAKISHLHINLESELKMKILRTISAIPFYAHHKVAATDRLNDSGKWLLQKKTYKDWRKNPHNSILWLHGIPGSGKTKLTSLVIDSIKKQDERIAFFYCARSAAEPFRADCNKILACLIRQLATPQPDSDILDPILERYEAIRQDVGEFEDPCWTTEECVDILHELLAYYDSVTIVVDALDEVNLTDTSQFIDALRHLAGTSLSLIKVFISSREIYGIAVELQSLPEIQIDANENTDDIEAFIDRHLQKAKLLKGALSPDLKAKVVEALRSRAQGMFRLVELQINQMRNLKTAADVESQLRMLPTTLEASYRDIYAEIRALGVYAISLANMTFQWLLVARDQITLDSFAELVLFWPNFAGPRHTASEIQDVCDVFISVELRVFPGVQLFRFSHLTVQEYFEGLAREEELTFGVHSANAAVAEACLSFLRWYSENDVETRWNQLKAKETLENPIPNQARLGELARYASKHLAHHIAQSGTLSAGQPFAGHLWSFLVQVQDDSRPSHYREDEGRSPPLNLPSAAIERLRGIESPVWLACDNDLPGLLNYFLNCRFDGVNDFRTKNGSSQTPFWFAIEQTKVEQLSLMLAHRPKDHVLQLPMHGIERIISAVLAAAGSVENLPHIDSNELNGEEPNNLARQIVEFEPRSLRNLLKWLHIPDIGTAISNRCPAIVRYWLLQGDINTYSISKSLILAVSEGDTATADVLLRFGAVKEGAAVARALRQGLYTTTRRLIEADYDIHGRYFFDRRTALHYAAAQGKSDIVLLLLERGAEIDVRDGNGFTAADLAMRANCLDVLELLARFTKSEESLSLSKLDSKMREW